MLLADHEHVYAFLRRLGDVELLVLGNFSGDTLDLDLPDATAWASSEILIGNYPATDKLQPRHTVRPWEARVQRRRTGVASHPPVS
jgi:oligo-1,6-glucosidase